MNVLDLFSGIGGFSLGLERAGMRTVAFCEIDPFCRRVLAKHWPGVPCYTDVRELTAVRLRDDAIVADVICGGFPCQDISVAGKGAGLAGERSGLWREFARIIGEVRPRYVIVENVAALLGRGLSDVLGDLAALGFDAEWHCIPACAVGAPHRRDRVWIVAYADSHCGRFQVSAQLDGKAQQDTADRHSCWQHPYRLRDDVADAYDRQREPGREDGRMGRLPLAFDDPAFTRSGENWISEPDVGRVAHGIPARVDRLKGLGNAVVPQIPEIIGRAIMRAA